MGKEMREEERGRRYLKRGILISVANQDCDLIRYLSRDRPCTSFTQCSKDAICRESLRICDSRFYILTREIGWDKWDSILLMDDRTA